MFHQPAILLLASLLIASAVYAQDAKQIEAAKKESGKIIAYGSMETNTAEPIIEAFTKKTGLQVEYWRASATKAMDRALTELRAGKHLFDVMVNNSGATTVMHKEGVFAKYNSPAAAALPKDVIDPDLGVSSRTHRPAFTAVDITDTINGPLMQAIPTVQPFITHDKRFHQLRVSIELPPLIPGRYSLSIWVGSHNTETLDFIDNCAAFNIVESPTKGRSFPHTVDHGHVVPHSTVEYVTAVPETQEETA